MNSIRFILWAATLSVLVTGSEPALSQQLAPCDKNHFILSLQCLPPNFQIPPVPPGVKHWTAVGPDGANVVALVIDPVTPSIAFAGSLGSGVLKTTDSGASWASVNAGLPTTNVLALAIDPVTPSTLYAATDTGVFKSTDAGRGWAVANAGLDGASVTLAIDPASPATLYAVSAGRLFKTTDGAASWTLNGGLSQYYIYFIAIDGDTSGVSNQFELFAFSGGTLSGSPLFQGPLLTGPVAGNQTITVNRLLTAVKRTRSCSVLRGVKPWA